VIVPSRKPANRVGGRNLNVPLFALLFFSTCSGYKELPVEYDYSYNGNFKKYRTYDMVKSTDSSMINSVIEKAIGSRMRFLGYRQSHKKPHLLVYFKMFPDSLMFNGIHQPKIEDWIVNQDENLDYNMQKLELKTGTLLIQFFDKRKNCTVWQGYSTAFYGSINFSENRNLRNAVVSILDKYRFWAEGFMDAKQTGITN
jgi:hypothetical protein